MSISGKAIIFLVIYFVITSLISYEEINFLNVTTILLSNITAFFFFFYSDKFIIEKYNLNLKQFSQATIFCMAIIFFLEMGLYFTDTENYEKIYLIDFILFMIAFIFSSFITYKQNYQYNII